MYHLFFRLFLRHVPAERAHELLRPLASEVDMSRVQQTLSAVHVVSGDPWLKRRRDSQAKLTGGDPVELAEIIRNRVHREWRLPAFLDFTSIRSVASPSRWRLKGSPPALGVSEVHMDHSK